MNKQRLLELAGVIGMSSNMNNPSQEPYTEIGSADEPTDNGGINGQDDLGGSGEEMDTIGRIKEEAEKGMESPEAAMAACETILSLLDTDEEEDGGEEF